LQGQTVESLYNSFQAFWIENGKDGFLDSFIDESPGAREDK